MLNTGKDTRELIGSEKSSTNQRTEIMAAITALEAIEAPAAVNIVSDSPLKDAKDPCQLSAIPAWRLRPQTPLETDISGHFGHAERAPISLHFLHWPWHWPIPPTARLCTALPQVPR